VPSEARSEAELLPTPESLLLRWWWDRVGLLPRSKSTFFLVLEDIVIGYFWGSCDEVGMCCSLRSELVPMGDRLVGRNSGQVKGLGLEMC
jgi:hypothetical protein